MNELEPDKIDPEEIKEYTRLSPEDLEIFLRLPVSRQVRQLLYETLKDATPQDRYGCLCGSSDEKTEAGSDAKTQGGG